MNPIKNKHYIESLLISINCDAVVLENEGFFKCNVLLFHVKPILLLWGNFRTNVQTFSLKMTEPEFERADRCTMFLP